jgi:hypothetical protein
LLNRWTHLWPSYLRRPVAVLADDQIAFENSGYLERIQANPRLGNWIGKFDIDVCRF